MALVFLLVFVQVTVGFAATWVVIAAGSKGYNNYRHQADACHAYQIVRRNGVPTSHIILMMENDAVNGTGTYNPFPGKLFNKPAKGTGDDVYAGCLVDYQGDTVTADLFMSVLMGDYEAVKRLNGGPTKVLQSTAQDDVFIYFVDHGGIGLIEFPNGPALHALDLRKTLLHMHEKRMYKELLLYVEACESGSMFEGILPENTKVYAATAANATEGSFGIYCPPDDVVDGQAFGSCLGDLWSVSWMEDADSSDLRNQTIAEQLHRAAHRTNLSHPREYGDASFVTEELVHFEGQTPSTFGAMRLRSSMSKFGAAVPARDIDIHLLYYAWLRAQGPQARAKAWLALESEQVKRRSIDRLFSGLALAMCASQPSPKECNAQLLLSPPVAFDEAIADCHRSLAQTIEQLCLAPGGWNAYSLTYSRTLWNACDRRLKLGLDTDSLVAAAKDTCSGEMGSGQILVQV